MTRKFTGAVHVGTRKVRRANGDVYVYERKTTYDQQTRKTVTIGCRLLGKIPSGETEMVPTRMRVERPKLDMAALAGQKEAD